jgi:hypothetical protein
LLISYNTIAQSNTRITWRESHVLIHDTKTGFTPNAHGVRTTPVVACILSNVDETIKANMASASVVLGLTPTILSILGSSTADISLLSIIGNRPLLVFLLAAGSPAVSPTTPFKRLDPLQGITTNGPSHAMPISGWSRVIIVAIEYIFTCGAIANIVSVSWQLCIQMVSRADYSGLLKEKKSVMDFTEKKPIQALFPKNI